MELLDHYRSSNTRRDDRRRWGQEDAALLSLIRLVLDDSWSANRAAVELRSRVADEAALHRVRARVRRALVERPTPVAERAARTLDVVLGDLDAARAPEGK